MNLSHSRIDPWVAGGLLLLGVLSIGTVQLYRTAPQSVGEARVRTLAAARPSAFTPRIERAEQRFEAAARAATTGSDSVAAAAFEEAAEQAWAARDLAETIGDRQRATELWGRAMLARATLLQEAGTGRGLRRDDNELLRQALAMVEQVLANQTSPALRERAEERQEALERKLRPRPLEWLPLPR